MSDMPIPDGVWSAHEGSGDTVELANPAASRAEPMLDATIAQQSTRPVRARPKRARGGGMLACCSAPTS